MNTRKAIWFGLLAVASASMVGCGPKSRDTMDGPKTFNTSVKSGRGDTIAMIVIDENAPKTKVMIDYAKLAADDLGCKLEVISAPEKRFEEFSSKITAAGATGARLLVLEAGISNAGSEIRNFAEESNLKLVTINARLLGESGKFVDVPFFGYDLTTIGNTAMSAAFEEAEKRKWDLKTVGVLMLKNDGGTESQGYVAGMKTLTAGYDVADRTREYVADSSDSGASAFNSYKSAFPSISKFIVVGNTPSGVSGAMQAAGSSENSIGVGIGFGAISALKESSNGYFAAVVVNPKEYVYDAVINGYKAMRAGEKLDTLPVWTSGTVITKENVDKVSKDNFFDKIPGLVN